MNKRLLFGLSLVIFSAIATLFFGHLLIDYEKWVHFLIFAVGSVGVGIGAGFIGTS